MPIQAGDPQIHVRNDENNGFDEVNGAAAIRGVIGAEPVTEYKDASFTAVVGRSYNVNEVGTPVVVTSPSGTEGASFNVFVQGGTVTVGGVDYTDGQTIKAHYVGGGWEYTVYISEAATQAALDDIETQQTPKTTWLMPFFQTASERLYVASSADGINWGRVASNVYAGVNSTVRDPAFYYSDGWWYLAYTPNSYSASQSLYIARSRDLQSWTAYATINCSSVAGASGRIWSPKWFRDDDGSVNIVIAINPDYSPTEDFAIYLLTATAADLSTWGAPALLFNTYQAIDPYIIKDGGTYYLWYKNETSGQKYIEVASSSTLTGTYTRILAGDWAGWGSGLEGASVIKRGAGDYLIYTDAYQAGLGMRYATSSALLSGWSALTTIGKTTIGATTMRHGCPMLVDIPDAQAALPSVVLASDRVYPRLETGITGIAAVANSVASFRVNQNATGTAMDVDFIPDIGFTPLAKMRVTRTSLATGACKFEFFTWDGSALVSRAQVDELGVTSRLFISQPLSGFSQFAAVAPTVSDAAGLSANPAGTISSGNPVWWVGHRHSAQGPLSFWRYNGSAHLATDMSLSTSGVLTTTGGFSGTINGNTITTGTGTLTLGTGTNNLTGLTVGGGTNMVRVKHGTATLVAGTVTVSDSTITANSRIFVNRFTAGGTRSASYDVTRTASTSFTITGYDGAGAAQTADTSVVAYQIIEP